MNRKMLAIPGGMGFMLLVIFIYFQIIDIVRPPMVLYLSLLAALLGVVLVILNILDQFINISEVVTNLFTGMVFMGIIVLVLVMLKYYSSAPYDTLDSVRIIISASLSTFSTLLVVRAVL